MDLKIKWTKRSLKNYIDILFYIQSSFGEKPAKEYEKRVSDLLSLLTKFPKMGTVQNEGEAIRGIVLYRRTTILYKIDFNRSRLLVVNILDNRLEK